MAHGLVGTVEAGYGLVLTREFQHVRFGAAADTMVSCAQIFAAELAHAAQHLCCRLPAEVEFPGINAPIPPGANPVTWGLPPGGAFSPPGGFRDIPSFPPGLPGPGSHPASSMHAPAPPGWGPYHPPSFGAGQYMYGPGLHRQPEFRPAGSAAAEGQQQDPAHSWQQPDSIPGGHQPQTPYGDPMWPPHPHPLTSSIPSIRILSTFSSSLGRALGSMRLCTWAHNLQGATPHPTTCMHNPYPSLHPLGREGLAASILRDDSRQGVSHQCLQVLMTSPV